MGKGLTYLINHINTRTSDSQDMSIREFVDHMRTGVLIEPEKIGELISAHKNLLDKFRTDLSPELRTQRSIKNIAAYVIMADHDYENEMIPRAASGGPKSFSYYLENPKEYGPATKALSIHLGLSGKNLAKFVLGDVLLKYN